MAFKELKTSIKRHSLGEKEQGSESYLSLEDGCQLQFLP